MGEADVGRGQRGRVVDAIAGHRNGLTRSRECLDAVELGLRKQVGPDVRNARMRAGRSWGRQVLAGQHDGRHAPVQQFCDRVAGKIPW
jgi:hypothetical protein